MIIAGVVWGNVRTGCSANEASRWSSVHLPAGDAGETGCGLFGRNATSGREHVCDH